MIVSLFGFFEKRKDVENSAHIRNILSRFADIRKYLGELKYKQGDFVVQRPHVS